MPTKVEYTYLSTKHFKKPSWLTEKRREKQHSSTAIFLWVFLDTCNRGIYVRCTVPKLLCEDYFVIDLAIHKKFLGQKLHSTMYTLPWLPEYSSLFQPFVFCWKGQTISAEQESTQGTDLQGM